MSIRCADVQTQYEQNKELKKEDVVQLQEWLKLQPHLPPISELQLILFLHSCYYSSEATKKTIDNFYTARTHCPEFFKNRDPRRPEIAANLKTFFINVLPKLTPEGYRVAYVRLLDPNPDLYHFDLHVKIFDMLLLQNMLENGCCNGYLAIFDMTGGNFAHLTKVSLATLKKFIFYIQEAAPVRIQGIHYMNPVPFMDKVLAMIKLFSNADLLKKIHVHKSNTIFNHVPPECLPNDCGGTLGPLSELHGRKLKILEENAEAFVADEKLVADESKRPGKPKNAGDLFGVEGTFKKLDID